MKFQRIDLEFNTTKIHAGYFQPDETKGVVILVHGFGEHSGRYEEYVIPMLLKTGFAVVVYDNFGHGQTEGNKGHCPSYMALLQLLGLVQEKANSLFPNKAQFLYGHSMGGNLVLNHALRNKTNIKGIIATSPYLRLAFQPPKWKMILGKAMLNVWPSLTLPSGLDPSGISRIPMEVEKYKSDPLVHDKVSPMFSFPIIDAGEWAIQNASNLNSNTLLLHGTGDPIIDFTGTEEFHENCEVTTLKLIDEGYHELHNDICREEVLNVIQNWLRQQL
ncbi:alpha/beta hydrolase [Maribacter sp. HTCC2170]|uniref:alpha/beta hydrolase n=1 Tax=Maribacter sp. (strain HTCC2170 / KCCM 42371) TaxID=313603 RepID=UPI00006B2201|nr:alpha/beta hydrolase [Maribacter sp. HTCC2170]EAR00234.1 lysophospholipase [Maribacter sp. HTCC2170]